MLKKYVGGLTLLVFTFTFVIPLLVGVNTADAGPTIVFTQDWLTEFFCPDGTYATHSDGRHVNEFYTNHPEEDCWWEDTGHEPWCFIWCIGKHEVYICQHAKHDTTYHHNETLDYTKVILWTNRHYCQDDDDEETTN